jgi:hypothetical protein
MLKKNKNVNVKFVKWLNNIESIVFSKISINLIDMPDISYMEHFENDDSYEYVAKLIVDEYYEMIGKMFYLQY